MDDGNVTRFQDRADDYARFRPTYPAELFAHPGLKPVLAGVRQAADVGAGTGIFSRCLTAVVPQVIAVEPEAAMCEHARVFLADLPGCRVVQGRAEATGLPAASVGLVTAAQAFHWFDREAFRTEARRILRPGSSVMILRNLREADDPFMREYEARIFRHVVRQRVTVEAAGIAGFFVGDAASCVVTWTETVDRDGLLGRVRSNSNMPRPGQDGYAALVAEVDDLFDRWQSGGAVPGIPSHTTQVEDETMQTVVMPAMRQEPPSDRDVSLEIERMRLQAEMDREREARRERRREEDEERRRERDADRDRRREEERKERGIESLPASLGDAIALTEKSELVRETLGEHAFQRFIWNKKNEWDEFRIQVTEWELQKYLPIL